MGLAKQTLLTIKDSKEYRDFSKAVKVLYKKSDDQLPVEMVHRIQETRLALERKISAVTRIAYEKLNSVRNRERAKRSFITAFVVDMEHVLPDYHEFFMPIIIDLFEKFIFERSLKS